MDSNQIFNRQSERGLLGAILIPNCDPQKKQEAFDLVHPEMLYLNEHRDIYNIMRGLNANKRPIDLITVSELYSDFSMIAEMAKETPSAANILGYVDNVRNAYYKRQLIENCQLSIDAVYSGEQPESVLTELESKLIEVSRINGADHIEHLNDIADSWVDEMERRMAAGGEITGQASGFEDLDSALLGFNKDDFIIVAGKPGTGKTLFSQSITRHVSINDNKPSLFFSMEMSRVQVYERFVSGQAKVPAHAYRSGYMEQAQWTMTKAASAQIKQSGIHIVSKPSLSVGQIRAMARKFKSKNPDMGLIVIDYLSKIKLPKADRHDIAIGMVTSALKEMAQELECPVVLLSQMNRGGDRVVGKRPQMTDLKDSSSIEQDADVILMLHREGRLNENYPDSILEVLVRKSRHVDAEKTVYLRCVEGGYQRLAEHEAMSEIETMSESTVTQMKRGGGF